MQNIKQRSCEYQLLSKESNPGLSTVRQMLKPLVAIYISVLTKAPNEGRNIYKKIFSSILAVIFANTEAHITFGRWNIMLNLINSPWGLKLHKVLGLVYTWHIYTHRCKVEQQLNPIL